MGSLSLADGSLTIDPLIKANLLSEYFGSTFTVDDGSRPTLKPRSSAKLSNIIFSQQPVFRALSKLKANSAGGPDGIPPSFLKNAHSCLSTPLPLYH